ncbi:hypothetical protein GOM49_12390 [Clostridium bovifaecis]|uniref:GyrI-like small molecule binding domain-containing protein n=1 Tax=Clostridium bovifaecis TaxID=2184719 RepID=A0A6I6EXX7_9CLOT|nr:hypothetical protein GOM49_12390 [Clostridium bovifaecis]
MNEKDAAVPQYVFKRANNRNDSNAIKSSGTYACIYQSIPNGKINEIIYSFIMFLSSQHIAAEGPLYLDSIANDFIRFPNEEYVFKLSIKCKL